MPSRFRHDLVPTWARVAAWAVPLTTLPSIVWRLSTVAGGLIRGDDPCIRPSLTSVGEAAYLLAVLPSVQLGLALLTVGLIRPWGEMLPRWLPVVGGSRVPVGLAVGAAVTGAVLLVAVVAAPAAGLMGDGPLEALPPGCTPPGSDVLRWYLPMVLWPPLLLAVTSHYRRRRRHTAPRSHTRR